MVCFVLILICFFIIIIANYCVIIPNVIKYFNCIKMLIIGFILQERRRIRSEVTIGLRKNKQQEELLKRRNVEVSTGKL